MKIDKVNNSFNTYKIELSFTEMMALYKGLAKSHADPVADEVFRGLQYYLDRVPGPGEDKEEKTKEGEDNIEIQANGDVDLDNLLPEPSGEDILEPAPEGVAGGEDVEGGRGGDGGEGEELEAPPEEEPATQQ